MGNGSTEQSPSRQIFVVMGVSGCGKSTVGQQLAAALGVEFLEGDQFHPPENVARMAAGTPLTDADRQGWLTTLAGRLQEARHAGRGAVLSCSALKRSYRDILRRGAPDSMFVHLAGSRELLDARMSQRTGHYMPASLLDSQLAILEPPAADENARSFDVSMAPEAIVAALLAPLRRAASPNHIQHTPMSTLTKVVLFTDADGRAKFREEPLALTEGTPQAMLSTLHASGGYQLRHSPVGFRSQFHCTGAPQWVFILGGQMEIGLQDGSSRVFKPGDHFYSADVLPQGATFDPKVHGHWSRQVGDEPLVTLFVRD
jgi:gluconokinase